MCFGVHTPLSGSVQQYVVSYLLGFDYIGVQSLMMACEHQNTEKVEHIYVIHIVLCRCWLCKWKCILLHGMNNMKKPRNHSIPPGSRGFSLPKNLQTRAGAHAASFLPALMTLSPQVKRSGHETDHSASTSAKVNNEWSYASTSPYAFVTCTGTSSLLC